jgi:Icc-related predicted phosphoesterase
VVISHVAPEGAGDVSTDVYHRGFGAYRWLLDRLRPPLWLHGHTTTALVPELQVSAGPTTVVNVTGAVVVELLPPA